MVRLSIDLKFAQSLDDLGLYEISDQIYNDLSFRYAQRASSNIDPKILRSKGFQILQNVLKDGVRGLDVYSDLIYIVADVPSAVITKFVPESNPLRNTLLDLNYKYQRGIDISYQAKQSFEGLKKLQPVGELAAKSSSNIVQKLSNIAAKNPELAQKTNRFIGVLSRYFPRINSALTGGVLARLNPGIVALAFSYPKIKEYIELSAAGKFQSEVWDDADKRAEFIEIVANVIGGFMVKIPGLNMIGGALMAIGTLSSLGRMGINRFVGPDDSQKAIGEMDTGINDLDSFMAFYKKSDPEVKSTIKILMKTIKMNPTIKIVQILSMPQVANLPWVKNQSDTKNQLKFTQLKALILGAKKLWS